MRKLHAHHVNRLLLAFVVVSVASAGFLFWFMGKRTEASLVEQMLHREQIVARAGARSIESFLELLGGQAAVFAERTAVVNFEPKAQEDLASLMVKVKDTSVSGFILIDSKGVIRFNANRDRRPDVGTLVADRDYFIWAKTASRGEVFVGQPVISRVGSSKGKFILPLVTPMLNEAGQFSGVLGAGILLSEVADFYLSPLKISENTRIYLVNDEGIMLHAPHEKFIGVNYFDYLEQNPFPASKEAAQKLREVFVTDSEGKIDVILPNERTGGLSRFLISHSSVNYGDQQWTLAIASPVKDALVFFPQFHGHQVTALVFFIIVILGISGIGILAARIGQRDSYLDGFAAGRDHRPGLVKKKKT